MLWLARSVVLFVVQGRETNIVDQRDLELQLWRAHRVRVVRVTLAFVAAHGKLDETSKALTLDTLPDGADVSVVYYRAG